MPQETIKASTRTLANGKVVKVKSHSRSVKGKGNTTVVKHGRRTKKADPETTKKGGSGDEFLKRKKAKPESGETVTHDPETNSTTWTFGAAKTKQADADEEDRKQKIAFHTKSIKTNEKLLAKLTKEHAAGVKSKNAEFVASTKEKMEGVQDMLDRSARLLAKHKGEATPKARFQKKEPTQAAKPEKPRSGPVATVTIKPDVRTVPIPDDFKRNEQQKVIPKPKANGSGTPGTSAPAPTGKPKPKDPGPAAKPLKAMEESDFSKSMKAWQDRNAKRGKSSLPPKPKSKKSTRKSVKRVFGRGGGKNLANTLKKISDNYGLNG